MRFADLYCAQKFRYSVEVFPPKTEEGVKNLLAELQRLKQIHPAYISVTYGALGSTRDFTQDLATRVQNETGIPTAFHFTCVGSSRADIKNYVTRMAANGLNLVVALRGDKPAGMTDFMPPADGFRHANELVAYLKTLGDFSIAVAGYPEKHIEALDLKTDIANLKRKVDAGADVIITQLFFDNDDFYRWRDQVQLAGVTVPILAGILPIVNLKQIQKITSLSGAKLPMRLMEKLEACGDNAAAVQNVGVEHASRQCADLKNSGVDGIHFYCLNRAESVLAIVKGLA